MAPARAFWKGYLKLSLSDRPLYRDIGDRASVVPPDQQEDGQ